MYEYINTPAVSDPWSEPPNSASDAAMSYDAIHQLLPSPQTPHIHTSHIASYAYFHHMYKYSPHDIPFLALARLSREANHALDQERQIYVLLLIASGATCCVNHSQTTLRMQRSRFSAWRAVV